MLFGLRQSLALFVIKDTLITNKNNLFTLSKHEQFWLFSRRFKLSGKSRPEVRATMQDEFGEAINNVNLKERVFSSGKVG